MRGLLATALILPVLTVPMESRADEWTDEDWADEHDLGVDFAYTSADVKLEQLFVRNTGMATRKLLIFLPEIVECYAARYFEPRDSEPFRQAEIVQHVGDGRVDVLATNIRDVHDTHRYELISWRVRFGLSDDTSGALRIGLGQRVLSRRGTYSSWLHRVARKPRMEDYAWTPEGETEPDGTRLVLGRVDDPEVEPAPPGRLKNAHAQLLRCIHNLVAKAISGAGCVRPPSDGDAIDGYVLAENACVSLPDIRRRLGVI